ncbi:STAS/SEC14 domain-containing protein [Hymenobacter sp. J193]|uniref:STAS/SEC14 domain-containing protein n=1 Tax=Hymenobacter sp. J193 TaxID=2898429 RepID=UPI002150C005|nr:STAS/SEC14 domain-containing protein [Hymenobacter sp. J193]MCR5888185.1 STAS/SEC14 domain-containing protein [Hymenobacter sp. J193]
MSLLYFENAAGRLLEDPAGFLRVVWTGRPRGPHDAQALFTHMQTALQRHGWSRIFIDQRQMLPFSSQEQTWVARHWLPQAVQAGYRHGAVLVSTDVMVRLATAYVTTQVQGLPLVYRSFETEGAAIAWLLQQPMTP